MRNATRQVLQRICEADLLAEAGKIFEGTRPGVIFVAQWKDALSYSTSPEWESVQLRKQNELSQIAQARAPTREWNSLVDEIKSILYPAIQQKEKVAAAAGKHWSPHVAYDLLAGCMEAEFADLCDPDYGTAVLDWYLRGRFPCGWGRFLPGGKIKLTEVPATNVPFTPETGILWPMLEHLSGSLQRLKLSGKLLVY